MLLPVSPCYQIIHLRTIQSSVHPSVQRSVQLPAGLYKLVHGGVNLPPGSLEADSFLSKNMSPKSLQIPGTDLVRRASSREESYCFSLNETSFHNFLSKLVFFLPFLTFHMCK